MARTNAATPHLQAGRTYQYFLLLATYYLLLTTYYLSVRCVELGFFGQSVVADYYGELGDELPDLCM